jgi:hypothetical protein
MLVYFRFKKVNIPSELFFQHTTSYNPQASTSSISSLDDIRWFCVHLYCRKSEEHCCFPKDSSGMIGGFPQRSWPWIPWFLIIFRHFPSKTAILHRLGWSPRPVFGISKITVRQVFVGQMISPVGWAMWNVHVNTGFSQSPWAFFFVNGLVEVRENRNRKAPWSENGENRWFPVKMFPWKPIHWIRVWIL